MNKKSEIKDTTTTKRAPDELSEQELEKASGGATDGFNPVADQASPNLFRETGAGKAGLPTKI